MESDRVGGHADLHGNEAPTVGAGWIATTGEVAA